jgi:predicted Ser/Thr protein kinase
MPRTILPAVPSGSQRWFRFDPFSSGGASLEPEENRAFLQARIAFFARFATVFVLATYAALVLAQRLDAGGQGPLWLGTYGLLHIATAAVLVVVWLASRVRPLSLEALGALDMIGSLAACTTASLVLAFPDATPDHKLGMLLGVSNALIARSAAIPSPARWTFCVSAAAVLPSVVLTYVFHSLRGDPGAVAARETATTALWCVVAVSIATLVSKVIYGLRRKVQQAQRLGQYTLEEKVAEGGMGVVYRARHAMLRRPTAVKLLPPGRAGEHNLKRFEREVQLTSILTHPNTVAIYDYGRTPDGVFYYAMEYLDGTNLEDLVRAHGAQPEARVVHVLRQICGSLDEAHGIGLIHRDIKPANVILCSRGGAADVVKVVDFGLVRDLHGTEEVALTSERAIAGTPMYLSPEAIRAPDTVDARSDLYAVGGVAYFLLTGQPVFEGRSLVEVCGHHLHTEPVPPSRRAGITIDRALEACVLACLEKDPQRRPQTAHALGDLLAASGVARWTEEDARAWWASRTSPRPTAAPPTVGLSESMTVDVASRV